MISFHMNEMIRENEEMLVKVLEVFHRVSLHSLQLNLNCSSEKQCTKGPSCDILLSCKSLQVFMDHPATAAPRPTAVNKHDNRKLNSSSY